MSHHSSDLIDSSESESGLSFSAFALCPENSPMGFLWAKKANPANGIHRPAHKALSTLRRVEK